MPQEGEDEEGVSWQHVRLSGDENMGELGAFEGQIEALQGGNIQRGEEERCG